MVSGTLKTLDDALYAPDAVQVMEITFKRLSLAGVLKYCSGDGRTPRIRF
jgi:hypothetical protein